jgi:hypothetical protein
MTRGDWLPLLAFFAIGCWPEQEQIGVDEPFRVHTADNTPAAQFRKGKLPGLPPFATKQTTTPKPAGDAGKPAGPPSIINVATTNIVFEGEGSVAVGGTATTNANTVALALEGIGTGYWVFPVGDIDQQTKDLERPWGNVSCDFDSSIPSGFRRLLAVAIDENNQAGRQGFAKICIANRIPDKFNSCQPYVSQPPYAVISLIWDTNVDLDLQVQTPNGQLIQPKNAIATLPNDAGKLPTTVDRIDRDSNAACVIDSINQEDFVFANEMPHGTYGIYANLFDACKQPAVHFRVEVWISVDRDPSADGRTGRELQRFYPRPEDPQGGELLDISANAGTARGLFVTEFKFK